MIETELRSYVIHLSSATARAQNAQALRSCLPNAQIFEATGVDDLTPELLEKHARRFCYFPPYPFTLRKTEIACFLSHRRVWQHIVDQEYEQALVVEDDVVLQRPAFEAALTLAQKTTGSGDFVRFVCEKRNTAQASDGKLKIRRAKPVGLGMQAQLIGHDAAVRLLAATSEFDRPVDTTLQLVWRTGQELLEIHHSGVGEISRQIGGSTIGKKKSLFSQLYREIARPAYRGAVFLAGQVAR